MEGARAAAVAVILAACSSGGEGWVEICVTADPMRVDASSVLYLSETLATVPARDCVAVDATSVPGTIVLRHAAGAAVSYEVSIEARDEAGLVPCACVVDARCVAARGRVETPGFGGRGFVARLDRTLGLAAIRSASDASCAAGDGVWAIAAGASHTCARRGDGTLLCWGGNDAGQLGIGAASAPALATAVAALDDAIDVALGDAFSCARTRAGVVRCWGVNDDLSLGAPIGPDRAAPGAAVAGISSATIIATGAAHGCAIEASGVVRCWGRGAEGQIGNGSTDNQATAADVRGLDAVEPVTLALGGAHGCVASTGAVHCWGANGRGQVGTLPTVAELRAIAVGGPALLREPIAAGAAHTCARQADGVGGDGLPLPGLIHCWGANDRGQLGDGTTGDTSAPRPVPGLTDVVGITAGAEHTCAWDLRGRAYCWGANAGGQLGDGTTIDRAGPIQVPIEERVFELGAGREHTCARTENDRVLCWGSNTERQLGVESAPPLGIVEVEGLR